MMWGGKVTHFKSLIKNPGHGLEGGLISQLKIHECFQMLLIKELSRLGLRGMMKRERKTEAEEVMRETAGCGKHAEDRKAIEREFRTKITCEETR